MNDDLLEWLDCPCSSEACLPRTAKAHIEAQAVEIEKLREVLIGIRAEIDDMENPFNGGGAPEMAYGFETAVEQAVNIVTAALENSGD